MSISPYVPGGAYLGGSLPSGIWSGVDSLSVLPMVPGTSITVTKAPKWSTQVVRSASGRLRTTAYWPYPVWNFELSYDVLAIQSQRVSASELATLWEFFNVMQGQFALFLFVDPSDCQIPSTAPVQFAVGDGSTKTFQLSRTINSWVEPVFSVFTPTILNNGVAAGAHTISNGQVTFTTAPVAGHVLTWFGYFYFGCHFAQDDLSFEQFVFLLWAGKGLKMTSDRR